MKSIGQFAKENNVTVKALHHYEKLNLVTPKLVDSENGYRYYSDSEALDLKLVLFLKNLGLSLSEIKNVLDEISSKENLVDILTIKKNQAKKDKLSASKRQHNLSVVIDLLLENNKNIDYKELLIMGQKNLDTGKFGRGEFIEESEKMFDNAKDNNLPLSVIQMDLDKFHKLNQEHGYEVGDVVLERTQDEILSMLQECKYQSIFERKGGDEFSITIQAGGLDASKLASDILNKVVTLDFSDVTENLRISISAGIACISKRTKSYSQLVHEATIKLYEIKSKQK